MDIALDEVIYFDAIASDAAGNAQDADSTPTFAVYEEATDTDIGVGGNMTKRTSLTGNYRGTFTLSAANGFEVGKWYSVIGSATIDTITTKGVLKHFRVVAAEAVAGYPKSDTQYVEGSDATNQIRDSVVDDSTRIDASALNTLSGHDPGETIMGATDAVAVGSLGANVITAASTHSDFLTELRTYFHGFDVAADMDANGRHRIVDGTGTGELDTLSGTVLLRSANEQVLADLVNGGRLDSIFDAILDDTGTAGVVVSGISAANLAKLEDMLDGTGGQVLTLAQLRIAANNANAGLYITNSHADGDGIHSAGGASGAGAHLNGTVGLVASGEGYGLRVIAVSGNAAQFEAANNSDALYLLATGTGKGINSPAAMQFDEGIGDLILTSVLDRLPAALISGRMDVTVGAMQANVVTAAASAADLIAEIQASITGGAYPLNTNSGGYVRVADGTGTGEIDTASGLVRLSAAGIDDIWDEVMEGSVTARQSFRLANAANAGKTSGGGTSNFLIRDLADSLNRTDATVDIDGNRTAVTTNLN